MTIPLQVNTIFAVCVVIPALGAILHFAVNTISIHEQTVQEVCDCREKIWDRGFIPCRHHDMQAADNGGPHAKEFLLPFW